MVVTAVTGLRHMLARSRAKQASSMASQQRCKPAALEATLQTSSVASRQCCKPAAVPFLKASLSLGSYRKELPTLQFYPQLRPCWECLSSAAQGHVSQLIPDAVKTNLCSCPSVGHTAIQKIRYRFGQQQGQGCGVAPWQSTATCTHRALPSNTHVRVHMENPTQEKSGIMWSPKEDPE